MNKIKNISNGEPSIVINQIPMNYGQKKYGVCKGPEILIKNGLIDIITSNNLNWKYNNNKIIIKDYKEKNKNISLNTKYIAKIIKKQKEASLILNIGGDHSISIGTISGLLKQNPNLGIIWIDAHPDINTIETSQTKNYHGMVNAFLLRLINTYSLKNKEFNWLNNYPKLQPNQIAYIGLRSIDIKEQHILDKLKKKGMFVSTNKDIFKEGIENIVKKALKSIGNRKIHISFDIDSIDPYYAPSTGTKCNYGLTNIEAVQCISFIKKYSLNNITSMDLVEINPKIGTKNDVNKTVKVSLDLIKTLLKK